MIFPKVSIVIPNWNLKKDLLACLASIEKLNYPLGSLEVIVVDNGSTDGSVKLLKGLSVFKDSPYQGIKIIENKTNLGFAKALNQGIKRACGKYVLLLNNDTILDKDFLKELVKVAERDKTVGAVGPKVFFYDRPEVIEKVYGVIDLKTMEIKNVGRGEKDRGQYDQLKEVEALVFVGLLVKKEVFKKIGLLDERYFILYEDVDFFLRGKQAGCKMVFVPMAKMWHKGSKSLSKIKPRIIYYQTRNRMLARSKFQPFSLLEHFKNLRFMVCCLGLMVFDQKKKNQYREISLGIFDFYRGRFGRQYPLRCQANPPRRWGKLAPGDEGQK